MCIIFSSLNYCCCFVIDLNTIDTEDDDDDVYVDGALDVVVEDDYFGRTVEPVYLDSDKTLFINHN